MGITLGNLRINIVLNWERSMFLVVKGLCTVRTPILFN